VARRRYHAAQETREMLDAAGIELVVVEDKIEGYEDQ